MDIKEIRRILNILVKDNGHSYDLYRKLYSKDMEITPEEKQEFIEEFIYVIAYIKTITDTEYSLSEFIKSYNEKKGPTNDK